MKETDKDIFSEEGGEPVITTTEEVSPQAPEATAEERPRGPDGKFVAKGETEGTEGEPPDMPEELGAPPAPDTAKHRDVPITALLDEREKRQRAEARLEQLEAQQRQWQQQQRRAEPPKVPDALDDPQGFQSFLMNQQLATIDQHEAQISERFARKEYGSEVVDAALAAAQQQGVVGHFTTGIDRWERMAKWHQAQQVMAEIGDDPVAYRERVRAESEEQARAKLEAENPRPKPPPPSMASASSSGAPRVGKVHDALFE